MKKIIVMLLMAVAASCNNQDNFKKAEDAQEAAQEFIRASLDGNYDKANFYLYKDSAEVNTMMLKKWKSDYDNLSQEEKVGKKEANIIVITTEKVNDSILNYVYSNTFKKDTTSLKIVRSNGEWLVDLKDIVNHH
jgi:Domain of unknown function (DUF4878)